MNQQGTIAFISVHGDPSVEIGKEGAGGQNIYVRQIGDTLASKGWKVDMFTRKVSPDQDDIVEHSPNCRTIRLQAGPLTFVERSQLFDYLPDFVDSFLQFQHQTERLYPLIHTNYWLSGWVGLQLKEQQPLRMAHTYHSLGSIKYQNVDDIPAIAKTRIQVEKDCLEQADRVVATSPHELHDMRSTLSPYGEIEVIPCGTNTSSFGRVSRAEARQKLGISSDQSMIIYVGRFDPRKGLETLVRAVNHPQVRQHPFHLYIVGGNRSDQKDQAERDRIEKLVHQLNLAEHVTFTGRLDHSQLPTYYAASDVCVVPSYYEPFGLVAIEAMASRIPVIASEVGGLRFTVQPDKTGLLAPAKDDEAFASCIDRILSYPELRDRLGQAGQQQVHDNFSWDGVTDQLSDLYQRLLADLHRQFVQLQSISNSGEFEASVEREERMNVGA